MIYSRIFGGLGNQLFQYAAGRALALRRGTSLVLDTRLASPGSHWAYGLDRFNIDARVAEPAELPPSKEAPIGYALWRLFGRSPRFLRERGLGVNNSVLNAPDDVYLHGYFQSERYFSDCIATLRDDLRFLDPPDAQNAEWLDHIAEGPSVSVHLRRGDYISNDKAGATHATCDQAYYTAAIAEVVRQTGVSPRIFVFSDDPDWARDNLRFDFETHVAGHNGPDRPHDDMRLIAACDHNVIANSTFSWWGAWLNASPAKCVVAPKRWFGTAKLRNPDIIPERWTAI